MTPKFEKFFLESLIELIRKTSCELSTEVVRSLEAATKREKKGSRARYVMSLILENVKLAKDRSAPLCQDTGSILFYIKYPRQFDAKQLIKLIKKAVIKSTRQGFLRQNSVDSLTGKNSGTNIGPGTPSLHFESWGKDFFEIVLLLKGGGSENVGVQYSLPDAVLGADRDLDGVRKCVLDAVNRAQGKGCGPGVLGVAIGGDRATGWAFAKELLLRKLGQHSKVSALARLESSCLKQANRLGIGPMGFGGKTTLLAVHAGALNRLPASFFVTVAYMCWAHRRQSIRVDKNGRII
jgi:fumarate hydratase class I